MDKAHNEHEIEFSRRVVFEAVCSTLSYSNMLCELLAEFCKLKVSPCYNRSTIIFWLF